MPTQPLEENPVYQAIMQAIQHVKEQIDHLSGAQAKMAEEQMRQRDLLLGSYDEEHGIRSRVAKMEAITLAHNERLVVIEGGKPLERLNALEGHLGVARTGRAKWGERGWMVLLAGIGAVLSFIAGKH